MGEDNIKSLLKNYGLSEKEAQLYIFLAKHGVLRAREISKFSKINKAEVYRILKSLQSKGIVEPTLESPIRFSIVPFEKIIDLSIQSKQEEVKRIKTAREELLASWKGINRVKVDEEPEKFVVIDGDKKIYQKISEMANATKRSFSAILTLQMLARLDNSGVLESAKRPISSRTQFNFLLENSDQNFDVLHSIPKFLTVRMRNADLGLKLFPRMFTKDADEILVYITPKNNQLDQLHEDTALWTNSSSIIQAFIAIFQDAWTNAADPRGKASSNEQADFASNKTIFDVRKNREKSHREMLQEAKKEILIVTSSTGLVKLSKEKVLDEVAKEGVRVRIMAPIVDENIKAAQSLANRCQVRHVSMDNLEMTIIDEKYLFQPKSLDPNGDAEKTLQGMGDMQLVDDYEYVDKMKATLDNIWKNASPPSFIDWEIGLVPPKLEGPLLGSYFQGSKFVPQQFSNFEDAQTGEPLQRVIDKMTLKNWTKEKTTAYGTIGQAIIQQPSGSKIPTMGLRVVHYNKESGFGEGNNLVVFLWLETPPGHSMVPVAVLADSPKEALINQKLLAGTPAARNIKVAGPNEFEVLVKEGVMFAGWTASLPIHPSEEDLAPSSLMFEAHGTGKRVTQDFTSPAGFKSKMVFTRNHAFVTFLNRAARYVGTGIQGSLAEDCVFETIPP